MNQDTLKSIIIEGQELLSELSINGRSFEFEPNARYVFTGIRQAGKSFLLYIRAKELIAAGHDLTEMLFVNFDDERLIGMQADQLDEILKAYGTMFEHKPIIFLDEIQNIEGWEHFVRRLANMKYMVYVTGSNAKMLSRDIATTLGARFIEQRVFPYSFVEYLHASGVSIDSRWQYGKSYQAVMRHLDTYFQWGGFPELIMYVNKRQWLNELYEKIILGDIIQRNKIKNEQSLRLMVKRLAENIKNPTSYNRLANMVKATGISTNVSSIAEYVQYCKDSCLLFSVENYASKFVEKETVKKHYFTDNGLLHIFLNDSDTALLENLCARTLYSNSFLADGHEFYFYNKEVEIDFYIPDKRKAIQASYSLTDPSTEEREVRALEKFHKLYGLDEAEIVTYSEERVITAGDLTINVIPLAQWLLR